MQLRLALPESEVAEVQPARFNKSIRPCREHSLNNPACDRNMESLV